jgi:hypothetical protein
MRSFDLPLVPVCQREALGTSGHGSVRRAGSRQEKSPREAGGRIIFCTGILPARVPRLPSPFGACQWIGQPGRKLWCCT